MQDEYERKSLPWFNVNFDVEGIVAALAIIVATALLSWITSWFGPLSFLIKWIGFLGAVAALLSARYARRVSPELPTGIVAPCDGIVTSITRMDPPAELRMHAASVTRVRLSTAPTMTNRIYAPITGSIESLILEAGDTSVPLAMKADDDGLNVHWLTLESRGQQVGIRLAAGGFGPRVEVDVEAGDVMRAGRKIAIRRLGGWCDVYVPGDVGALVWPGQTLVGAETVIGRLKSEGDADLFDGVVEAAEPVISADTPDDDAEDDALDGYEDVEEAATPEDPTIMFARLKEASRKHGESD